MLEAQVPHTAEIGSGALLGVVQNEEKEEMLVAI